MARSVRGRVALIEAGSPGLNIYSHVAMGRGSALLATVVRDAGYEARAFIEDISGKGTVDWEFVRGADAIGFSAITCTMPRTRELIAEARRVNPTAPIVLGGPEPTCDVERSFEAGADLVLRGEAELTLPRLLGVLTGTSAESFADIPGLVWLEEGARREGPPPRQLVREELDALPAVDRTLVLDADKNDVAPVWRTRGCPMRCDFCEVCEIWPRCVTRDDERSLEELMQAQEAGYPTAFLIDDNAAANKPRFMQFLRQVVERGYGRMLVMQLRADSAFLPDGRIDKEFLKLLKKAASVTVICVGVESASDEDLAELHKKIDSTRMAKALKAMRRRGLLVHGMFMALKDDTGEVIRKNGEYARKYVTSLQYLFETPLPGTKRTAEHEEGKALLFPRAEDLALYDGMHVTLRPSHMAAGQMQELVVREYERFYSTGRIVKAALVGAFGRFRRLTKGQRMQLRELPLARRIRRWAWFHIEYKFAPVSFLAIGRQRIAQTLRDNEYEQFAKRLEHM